jgi:cytidine deaminase
MEELLKAASEARLNAYAPYSGYKVGAAVRASSGRVFAGCNVENVAYGSTICAERNAILSMVAAGETRFSELLLLTGDLATPCGACLQVLAEFATEKTMVHCRSEAGENRSYALADLFPHAFASASVKRTEP